MLRIVQLRDEGVPVPGKVTVMVYANMFTCREKRQTKHEDENSAFHTQNFCRFTLKAGCNQVMSRKGINCLKFCKSCR